MNEARAAWVALALTPGVGLQRLARVVAAVGSADGAFGAPSAFLRTAARLPSAWPSTSVRKMPSLRSWARKVFGESASSRPLTVFPAVLRPLYSKTGMVAHPQPLG